MNTCMYIYIYMNTYKDMHICVHKHIYIYVYIYRFGHKLEARLLAVWNSDVVWPTLPFLGSAALFKKR